MSRIDWLESAVEDLSQMDPFTVQTLVERTIKMLGGDPYQGQELREIDMYDVKKIKPLKGYWVIYMLNKDKVLVTAISECKREITRGSKSSTIRINQIREETNEELGRLRFLLSSIS